MSDDILELYTLNIHANRDYSSLVLDKNNIFQNHVFGGCEFKSCKFMLEKFNCAIFRSCTFENCYFAGEITFCDCLFSHCKFINCIFDVNMTFQNCNFNTCEFTNCDFTKSWINTVIFNDCIFESRNEFYYSKLYFVSFINSSLCDQFSIEADDNDYNVDFTGSHIYNFTGLQYNLTHTKFPGEIKTFQIGFETITYAIKTNLVYSSAFATRSLSGIIAAHKNSVDILNFTSQFEKDFVEQNAGLIIHMCSN